MEKFTPAGMELTLRTLAMPADTNAAGHIFGGWVMSQMDLAAAVRANEISGGRTVTAAVTDMQFRQPVDVGDTLCVYSRVQKIGRTSITLELEVWARRSYTDHRDKVTEAIFVMVAVESDGTPRPITDRPGGQ